MTNLNQRLIDACYVLLESADNEGCSEDLTVVRAECCKEIETILKEIKGVVPSNLSELMSQFGGG